MRGAAGTAAALESRAIVQREIRLTPAELDALDLWSLEDAQAYVGSNEHVGRGLAPTTVAKLEAWYWKARQQQNTAPKVAYASRVVGAKARELAGASGGCGGASPTAPKEWSTNERAVMYQRTSDIHGVHFVEKFPRAVDAGRRFYDADLSATHDHCHRLTGVSSPVHNTPGIVSGPAVHRAPAGDTTPPPPHLTTGYPPPAYGWTGDTDVPSDAPPPPPPLHLFDEPTYRRLHKKAAPGPWVGESLGAVWGERGGASDTLGGYFAASASASASSTGAIAPPHLQPRPQPQPRLSPELPSPEPQGGGATLSSPLPPPHEQGEGHGRSVPATTTTTTPGSPRGWAGIASIATVHTPSGNRDSVPMTPKDVHSRPREGVGAGAGPPAPAPTETLGVGPFGGSFITPPAPPVSPSVDGDDVKSLKRGGGTALPLLPGSKPFGPQGSMSPLPASAAVAVPPAADAVVAGVASPTPAPAPPSGVVGVGGGSTHASSNLSHSLSASTPAAHPVRGAAAASPVRGVRSSPGGVPA